MSFDPNAIGNRIFTLRTNAKLSQEKLAEKLGVSHNEKKKIGLIIQSGIDFLQKKKEVPL